MTLHLSKQHADAIRTHGEQGYPHEVCGLLLGRFDSDGSRVVGEIFALENERIDSRTNRYSVSGASMFRAERHASSAGLAVIGYYHSHPNAPARPSEYDLTHATWPGISYPIVSVIEGVAGEIRNWTLLEDRSGFVEERFVVAGEPESSAATQS
ncbi:MAG TPA: M67 family metallopeptidase [Blastocatellia bacterium]|nr:M67 family metallopeptidase [Blastocatellia bacterium]